MENTDRIVILDHIKDICKRRCIFPVVVIVIMIALLFIVPFGSLLSPKKVDGIFNIKSTDITPGDDFGMMREVLERRFGRALKEAEEGDTSNWPDVLLIDGGAGQYSAVRSVLDDLGVTGVKLVGIAKGPDRDAGKEWFYTEDKEPFQLDLRDPVLYYLQRLRDEAHRFAITTHRSGRSKTLVKSELDDVPGIGPARKKLLLNTFGSARAIKQAGLAELEAAPGISRETARAIYGHFHPDWTPE